VQLNIGEGSCSFNGTVDGDFNASEGAGVRVSGSFGYRRRFQAKDIEGMRCGPEMRLVIDGQTIYKNPTLFFKDEGVVSGFVELVLSYGRHTMEIQAIPQNCPNGALEVVSPIVEAVVVQDNKEMPAGPLGVSRLFQK